ncbi:hypothetical protein GCM10023259_103920 [Thermocatellispora tengchongensis]
MIVAVANVLQSLELRHASASNLSASEIDTLARQARSDAEKRGQLVVRPHATYVLQAANQAGRILPATNANDLRHILLDRILAMGELNGLISKSSDTEQEVREWLGLEAAPAPNQRRNS